MISVLVFICILSILIVVHEFGHFMAAKKIGVRVEKFSLGFGTQLFKHKKGETEYSVSAVPLGGYVKLAGDSLEEFNAKDYEYLSKPAGKRFWVIVLGPLLNYLLGFLCFWLIFTVGYPALTAKVGGVMDGFGAKIAGIKPGDKVLEIDGEKVVFWEDLQKIIQAKSEASKVSLLVLRDSREEKIDVVIKQDQFSDILGQKHKVGLLGITPDDEFITVRKGVLDSFVLGWQKTWELTILTYKGLWRVVTGKLAIKESVTGPLGIFYITSKAARLGIIAILHLMAVLSISLAIFNLLPLPILDGGHIALLLVEKIRGRMLSLKTDKIITKVGMTLMISLAIFVTYNDVLRLFGDKIIKIFGK
ncbi:MAG: RIP metalloprotease RseP [Candidatus Omnitrophica bacterium]|nr:RIP metalloprotease RseP [Candidatus Omnitrophota bacterium]